MPCLLSAKFRLPLRKNRGRPPASETHARGLIRTVRTRRTVKRNVARKPLAGFGRLLRRFPPKRRGQRQVRGRPGTCERCVLSCPVNGLVPRLLYTILGYICSADNGRRCICPDSPGHFRTSVTDLPACLGSQPSYLQQQDCCRPKPQRALIA